MLSHEEMIALQAEKHGLIGTRNFPSKEKYVLQLMHTYTYFQVSRLAENKKVLDLGCNVGYGSAILFNSAKKVVGVDVSEKAITTANNEYGHLGIDFQLIDGQKLPFEDNEFDMIASCQVIEHIVDYDVYISELKRVLSPNGIVVFTTPNSLLRLDPGMKPWNSFHVREFDHPELESLLNKFFSVVQISGLFAEEQLYSVEKNRVDKAREKARRQLTEPISDSRHSLQSSIKAMLPTSVLAGLRRVTGSSSNITPVEDRNFMNEHGMEGFFYRSNDLESALDLLAICSDDESCLPEIQHQLTLE